MRRVPEAARVSRRNLLGGAAAGAVAVATGTTLLPRSADASEPPAPSRYAFEGRHQRGIMTPPQAQAIYVALDLTTSSRPDLVDLFREITSIARSLTVGGTPRDAGLAAPPADSGILGPKMPADGLTITTSVGSTLFDDRFGLAGKKPARLRRMEDFANDNLDRAVCDGDLLLQICAEHQDTTLHALREITRATRGAMQVRWRRDGFHSPPRPAGSPRNLMGFRDGSANPSTTDSALMNQLVWTRSGGDEPDWVDGGSYHVVRQIRMLVEFWDRISIREQENIFGRRRDSGAPLTGSKENDAPDYAADPSGEVIQMDAHIRLANPRTSRAKQQQILRRGYNYDAGTDANGNLDMGLIFTCFNADLERQFVTIQKRLADEPLVDYISPVGGGYFFALPGVRDHQDWLGRRLLA
ncbi:MAG: deferrochelatase/peroxidase EfeB [Nocardioidaceae bacterium]|nr:deferrochelatase/peroxidase EfeB [Nocardioidaceae bacterium]